MPKLTHNEFYQEEDLPDYHNLQVIYNMTATKEEDWNEVRDDIREWFDKRLKDRKQQMHWV